MMENPSILDLDYSTLSRIRSILENPSTMQSFLEVLPPDCTTEAILNTMDIEGRKYNMSPAKYLLNNVLGSKDYRVSHLIEWFEAIHLEKALVHLKKPEDVKIVQHPCEAVSINEGDELLLTCHAISYPPPEYQWFKFDEELLLQVEPVLSIKSASVEDSGQYTCLVMRRNAEKNLFDYIYSNPSCVEVIPSDLHATPSLPYNPGPSMPNFEVPKKNVLEMTMKVQDETVLSSKAISVSHLPNLVLKNQTNVLPKEAIITIKKHPYIDRKVGQGTSVCLTCDAVCTIPVSYQWLRNGRSLPDETSHKIDLINLFPDPNTGESKWEYQCKVYNEYDEALSRSTVVELDEVNSTTPFTAHEKIAFMVANDTYDHLAHLLKPAADVADVAKILSAMDFKILPFRNLTYTEMRNAFAFFCKMLKPGSYAVFFFSGHGFEVYGQTYLQPVDCGKNYLQQESFCSEYILECLQETKPAMNVLIIDACRNLPSIMRTSNPQNAMLPGKIFEAKMKNNTTYGYSTSFLSASHESDNEANSVFVKHLKKYLTYNKRVEEILMMVQEDCGKDPLIKGVQCIQCPAIKSTLQQKRKLTDPLLEDPSTLQTVSTPDLLSTILHWCDIKRKIGSKTINFVSKAVNFKTALLLEFHHHREVFCNGMDVFVYLYIEPGANLFILKDMEINISFKSDILNVLPSTGIFLKNVSLQIESKTLLFKKEVLDIQKINVQRLEGEVSLRFCSKNTVQSIPFSVDIPLSELQLSVNHLQSNNIESHNYRVIQNYFK